MLKMSFFCLITTLHTPLLPNITTNMNKKLYISQTILSTQQQQDSEYFIFDNGKIIDDLLNKEHLFETLKPLNFCINDHKSLIPYLISQIGEEKICKIRKNIIQSMNSGAITIKPLPAEKKELIKEEEKKPLHYETDDEKCDVTSEITNGEIGDEISDENGDENGDEIKSSIDQSEISVSNIDESDETGEQEDISDLLKYTQNNNIVNKIPIKPDTLFSNLK